MENKDSVHEYDYSELENISIEEVKVFFNKRAYAELGNLNITNVGDLLRKDISGELIKIFYQKHIGAHELWNSIHDTISFLKYKYLGIEFNFDVSDNREFSYRSGFSGSIRKRLVCYKTLNIDCLLKMVEENDFSKLYMHFTEETVDEIVSKVKVIRDYLKSKSTVTIDDLKALYEELSTLVKEYQRLGDEIDAIQNKINLITNVDKKI